MKWRRYIGLDLHDKEIRVVALRKRWRRRGQIVNHQVCSLPIGSGMKSLQSNASGTDPALAVSLRDALLPVALKERRVALSLPDRCGYVLVVEIDSFSRSRREGREVVGWQLGNLLPGKNHLHFDYQVLRRTPGGPARVLVVAIEQDILGRYEALLQQAGLTPDYIGFYGLNLYRHWRYRLETEGDAVLVSMNEDGVILQIYRDGVLEYYRARAVGAELSHQVKEVHRIVAGRGKELSGRGGCRVFLHADMPVEPGTEEALNECFGRKILVLEEHSGGSTQLAAAVGAAERMMMGG